VIGTNASRNDTTRLSKKEKSQRKLSTLQRLPSKHPKSKTTTAMSLVLRERHCRHRCPQVCNQNKIQPKTRWKWILWTRVQYPRIYTIAGSQRIGRKSSFPCLCERMPHHWVDIPRYRRRERYHLMKIIMRLNNYNHYHHYHQSSNPSRNGLPSQKRFESLRDVGVLTWGGNWL
jgi:hypothetical protein